VLELSVTDRDPRIAAKIANALAPEIIRERANLTSGATQRTLSTLDDRIARLNLQVGRLDARLQALNQQLATAKGGAADPVQVHRDQTSATRDTLAAQANALQTERDSIASVNAVQPQGGVISPAAIPTQANSTGRATKLVLGFLLGLLLGVGTAALLATLRPMLVGGYTLAEELGLPLLRQLSTAPDEPARPDEVGPLAERLRLAAETAHVRRVCLVGAGSGVDVGPLAELLDDAVRARPERAPEPGGGPAGSAGRTLIFVGARREAREAGRPQASDGPEVEASGLAHPRIRVVPADFRGSPVANGGGTALALVSAAALSKAELADAMQLLRVSPVATLGLISYGRASRRHRRFPKIFGKA
jgi:capsular polysaccharide biosynthesis protein